MTLDAIAAGITAVVGLLLASSFWNSHQASRRPYKIWWAVSFFATALASALQVAGFVTHGFTPRGYDLYVIFAAAVPGLMGAGSVYLLFRKAAPWYAAIILASVAVTVVGVLTSPLHTTELASVMQASVKVTKVMPGGLVALGFALLGGLGGLALVVGAIWSWIRTRQVYNLGIAAGGIVFSLADTMATYGSAGAPLFYLAEILGALILYASVVRSRAPQASESPAPVESGRGA
jgi:hypothetical protein